MESQERAAAESDTTATALLSSPARVIDITETGE
jgi:hypothetical protein